VNQATVQFVTGDLDVDKDWDTYLQKLDSMGVQNYIDTYQKYYDAYTANAK
jgi:putative aldouronate transport system substrate-binding protein